MTVVASLTPDDNELHISRYKEDVLLYKASTKGDSYIRGLEKKVKILLAAMEKMPCRCNYPVKILCPKCQSLKEAR